MTAMCGAGIIFMGISRAVDAQLTDAGYAPRRDFPPISEQLERAASLGPEIVLADDVLFSGEMIASLTAALAARGTRVAGVICGVAIGEGADKLEAEGIAVDAVVRFPEVEDELCERDFAVVPGSGRRLSGMDRNALYFDNVFGRPNAWASIPPGKEAGFCVNSLLRSASLLSADVPMGAIGNFLGYEAIGNAATMLQQTAIRRMT